VVRIRSRRGALQASAPRRWQLLAIATLSDHFDDGRGVLAHGLTQLIHERTIARIRPATVRASPITSAVWGTATALSVPRFYLELAATLRNCAAPTPISRGKCV
jgi:hypothetical protein